MSSLLRINGFKTDAPYNAMYFRCTYCKGLIGYCLIGYFAGGGGGEGGERERNFIEFSRL